ncbi:MAG: molybdopterin-dependent oxidoreductase [Leptolinea sp.]
MTPLHLTINDKILQAIPGQTILQVAQQNGIDIPTLCAYKDLPPFGGCRICVVEVDRLRGFPTACTTPAEEGMVVRTETPALQSLRLETLNMLLSEHPLSCLVCEERNNCNLCMETIRKGGVTTGCGSCPKDQQCELQTLSHRLGVEDIRLPVKYRFYPVEKSDPFYDRDYNLCILCGRCVQVCEKLHFFSTLTFVERGPRTMVGTGLGKSHVDAGCSFCGACVERCPTGALAEKTRKWEGIPDREVETTCPYCAAGCSVQLHVRRGVVIGSRPGNDISVNGGNLCVHGRFGISEMVNHPTRLQKPWQLLEGRKFQCSWEEAIDLAAEKLSACQPNQVVMQVSASLPSEDIYLAQKFADQVLHIPTLFDKNANPPSGFQRLASQAATFDQLRAADCILAVGLDTRYSAAWLEYELKQCKQKGAILISINNGEQPLEQFANLFLHDSKGRANTVISRLVEVIKNEGDGTSSLDQAAEALRTSQRPFILVGSEYQGEPQIIDQIAQLAEVLKAGVICLPLQGNFYGALLIGALTNKMDQSSLPAVLYCIGDDPGLPAEFTILQNAFAPEQIKVDLGLPSAVFSERDGTFYNGELRQRSLVKAVEPPGMALPDWQILTAIARRMGSAGFEFHSTAEIREELEAAYPVEFWKQSAGSSIIVRQSGTKYDPVYLGVPLSSLVAGLRTLLPSNSAEERE